MFRHLIGDLVTLEHMLKCIDLETDLVGDTHQTQDFVRAVRVGVHKTLAVQYLDQCFELQVTPWRRFPALVGAWIEIRNAAIHHDSVLHARKLERISAATPMRVAG